MVTEKRGALGFVAVLVIGLVVGLVVGFILDNEGETSTPKEATPNQAAGPGPTDEVNSVPVGYAQTEEGAVAAATNFHLLSGRDDLLSADDLSNAMKTLAAPSWADEAERQAKNGYSYIAETYGSDADVTTAVVRYDLTSFDEDQATVRLWVVATISGSSRPNVEATWSVVTTKLQWADDDWRVAGTESAPGPAPVELPSRQSALSARDVMEDFSEFLRAPTP